MTLALLSTAQHVSDVNTSIFRSLRLFVALCRLTWGVLVLCSGIFCWWCGNRVQAEPLIKLVKLYSNIKMMHGPIRIRYSFLFHTQHWGKKFSAETGVNCDNWHGVTTWNTAVFSRRLSLYTKTTIKPCRHKCIQVVLCCSKITSLLCAQ